MADAEDRGEAATSRRLQTAREAGQVPLSREAAPFAVLGATALLLSFVAPALLGGTARHLAALLVQSHRLTAMQGMAVARWEVLRTASPFVLAALLAGTAVGVLQTGFLIHLEALLPDLSRLDPRRGLRRIAGSGTLLETGKAILKMAIVAWVAWHVVGPMIPTLPRVLEWDAGHLLGDLSRQITHLLLTMAAAQGVIAAFDIGRARFQHARSLRMSRQEVRDELRDSDGDPQIKARRRALQRQRARRRMLAAVPKATVVITNPTHFAVALVYARAGGAAPRVVAKGVDEVARRIREVAAANGVPMVANPPLARALHEVPLDAEIPAEHYKAVAEIIAYIWRLRTRMPERPAHVAMAGPVT